MEGKLQFPNEIVISQILRLIVVGVVDFCFKFLFLLEVKVKEDLFDPLGVEVVVDNLCLPDLLPALSVS